MRFEEDGQMERRYFDDLTELQRAQSKPSRGFASIKCQVTNQRREPVIEYGYRYLIACRDFEAGRV
jgi:acyl dehydratase